MLDHQSEQQIVGVRIPELLTGGSAIIGDQVQEVGGLQLADGRPIAVEVKVRGKVVSRRVVEVQLAGLDHLHHLCRDHRLGHAADRAFQAFFKRFARGWSP